MKTLFVNSIFLGMLLFAACTETENESQKIAQEQLEISNDSLRQIFTATLDEIDQNIQEIKDRQGAIILGPESNIETGISTKERILRNIQMINSLMEQNKEKLQQLEQALAKSNKDNKALRKLTDETGMKILAQEKQILLLKDELRKSRFEIMELNATLSDLEMENEKLNGSVTHLEEQLNTAYVVMGSYKELKNNGILEKEGGLLGLGRTKTLSENLQREQFHPIDVRETHAVKIGAKKAILISKHPAGSYEFEKNGKEIEQLKITNPEAFWQNSKYLVIEIKA